MYDAIFINCVWCDHHHRKEDHDQESHLAPNILDLCSETCNLANRVGDFSSRQVLNNLCLIFDTLWYSSVAWQERKRFWRHHQNLFRNPILKRVNHLIQFSKTLLQVGLEVSTASVQVIDHDENQYCHLSRSLPHRTILLSSSTFATWTAYFAKSNFVIFPHVHNGDHYHLFKFDNIVVDILSVRPTVFLHRGTAFCYLALS